MTPQEGEALHKLCKDFIERHRVSCAEATVEDRVYQHAPELVEGIGKIVGFYRYPDEDADA